MEWGYIGKILGVKSLIFWHVALTLSHLIFNLTIHSNPPYFLHFPPLTHFHHLTHPNIPNQTIIYSHSSPLFTTHTHIIYLQYPSLSISNHSSTPILSIYPIDLIGYIGWFTYNCGYNNRDKIKWIILPLNKWK